MHLSGHTFTHSPFTEYKLYKILNLTKALNKTIDASNTSTIVSQYFGVNSIFYYCSDMYYWHYFGGWISVLQMSSNTNFAFKEPFSFMLLIATVGYFWIPEFFKASRFFLRILLSCFESNEFFN